MSIFNRRNAALGWLTWLVGKRVVKRKAKATAQAIDLGAKHPRSKAFAVLAASAAGAVAFVRRRRPARPD